MKRILLLFILSSFILAGFGQSNEANMWIFGRRAGLNFNFPAGPQPYLEVADDFIYAQEGCASIASSSGELMFYTDGQTIWNKNHLHMENGEGLYGHYSSTQSGIIVPKPEDPNTYYVFTVPYMGDSDRKGLRFSVVDISQNGGLGKVIEKNNILALNTPVTEKVTAMRHGDYDSKDIWVITHKWETFKELPNGDTSFYPSDTFLTYRVTPQGVNITPVISKVGRKLGENELNSVGYLKGSPSGDKLAMAVHFSDYYQLFDFDPISGVVANPITFDGFKGAYGLEFSPNSRFLYLSAQDTIESNKMHIYQYDLFAGDSNAIKNSKVYIGSTAADPGYAGRGALQVGPDQKIYISRAFLPYLAIINNPNLAGESCELDPEGIWLGSSSYRTSMYGLPTFIQTYFAPPRFEYENICWGDETVFTVTSDITGYQSVHWDFGDGGVSDELSPTHKFADWGTHIVTLVVSYLSTDRTAQEQIYILPKPTANFSYEPYCFGAPTKFHDQSNPNGGTVNNWSWEFGDGGTSTEKNPQHTFATQGQHNVKLTVDTDNGCISDPVTLPVIQIPPPTVSATPTGLNKMCENSPNSSYNTTGAPDAVSYIWSISPASAGTISGTTKNATVNWNDTFYGNATIRVTSVNQCNEQSAASGPLQVTVTALPEVFAGEDATIVYNSPYYFADADIQGNGPYTIQWEPADSLLESHIQNPTSVYLRTNNLFTMSVWDANNCYEEDQVLVKVKGGPLGTSIITDRDSICYGGQTQLIANPWGGSEEWSYEWTCDPNPGGWHSTLSAVWVSPEETTIYTLTVNDGINDAWYSITITVIELPVADAGDSFAINWGTTAQLDGSAAGGAGGPYSYLWGPEGYCFPPDVSDPVTVKLFDPREFSLEITDRFGCKDTDKVTVTIIGGPINVLAAASDSVICYGDSVFIDATPAGGSQTYNFFRWRPRVLVADSTAQTTYTSPLYITTDFIVRVQDDSGNEAHDTVTVIVNPLPETLLYPGSIPIGNDPVDVCVYDTLVLRPYTGTEEVVYLWSNGSIDDTLQVQTTGVGVEVQTYWVRTELVKTGCVNSDTVTLVFTYDACVGIGEVEDHAAFMLFPNPAVRQTNLWTRGLHGKYTLILEDMKGMTIREDELIVDTDGPHNHIIDLAGLSPGIYLVRLKNASSVYINKLIIR
ncbi:MAG TPA: PKD domain-containing protein [Bacteroidales bacterium]|nr:PKD domain-containing protein [Bacteroidales bacterium]HNS47095.1 PKD domain-containing protein [Bacteroidales bacterium]